MSPSRRAGPSATSKPGSHSARHTQTMRLLALVLVGLILGVATAGARSVTGTPRSDQLFGTPRADLIRGLGGSDALLGGSGADFLQGGPGRDTHDAGPGNDLIASSYDGARDVIRCGTGLDVVNADLPDSVGERLRARRAPALARSLPCGRRAARDRGRARQLHVRSDDRCHLPGRKTLRRRCDERRVRGDGERRRLVAERPPAWPHRCEPPCRRERASQRPRRRVRRGALDVAHLHARSRRHDDPARDQPLAGRLHVGDGCHGARGARGGGNRLRQELARVRQRRRPRRSSAAATSCTRTPPIATCSRSAGLTTGVSRGRCRSTSASAVGSVSFLPSDRTAISSSCTSCRPDSSGSPRRARRTEPRPGMPRCASRRSTEAARSAISARFRCPLRKSTRRAASGPRGTTARRPVRRATPCSWRPRPTARSGARRSQSHAAAMPSFPRSGSTRRPGASRSPTCVPGPRASTWSSRCRRALPRAGRRQAALGAVDASAVDARHDFRPHARRLHLGALRARTPARRLGARHRAGRHELSAGGLRDARLSALRARSGARRSSARGTPRSPTGSAHRRSSGRRA